MSIWHRSVSVQTLNERCKNTLISHLGISFIEIGDNFLVAKMPVLDCVKQGGGILHGGASCVLAETVGSMAGNLCVDFSTHYCVGLEININHISTLSSGFLYAKTSPYHIGKRTQVWHIELTNDEKKLIAISRHTVMVLARKKE